MLLKKYIKLPQFIITPSGWKFSDLLKGVVPKVGIKWYADWLLKEMNYEKQKLKEADLI